LAAPTAPVLYEIKRAPQAGGGDRFKFSIEDFGCVAAHAPADVR